MDLLWEVGESRLLLTEDKKELGSGMTFTEELMTLLNLYGRQIPLKTYASREE